MLLQLTYLLIIECIWFEFSIYAISNRLVFRGIDLMSFLALLNLLLPVF